MGDGAYPISSNVLTVEDRVKKIIDKLNGNYSPKDQTMVGDGVLSFDL